jgi:hypothetical protein
MGWLRLAVVRSERPFRRVLPPALARNLFAELGIQRVVDSYPWPRAFASDEKQCVPGPVVDGGVRDPGAGGERGEISALHSMKMAVDPEIDLAFQHVDELLEVSLGVGKGGSASRGHALQMNAETL